MRTSLLPLALRGVGSLQTFGTPICRLSRTLDSLTPIAYRATHPIGHSEFRSTPFSTILPGEFPITGILAKWGILPVTSANNPNNSLIPLSPSSLRIRESRKVENVTLYRELHGRMGNGKFCPNFTIIFIVPQRICPKFPFLRIGNDHSPNSAWMMCSPMPGGGDSRIP